MRASRYGAARRSERESGGIGRRRRLKIVRRKAWGFESPLSHQPCPLRRTTLPMKAGQAACMAAKVRRVIDGTISQSDTPRAAR